MRLVKSYSAKHTDDFGLYTKCKVNVPVSKLFGIIPTKFVKKECFALTMCCGVFGSWYSNRYYSLKDLLESIKRHWGELSPGAFIGYCNLPNTEYLSGLRMSKTKDALYLDCMENAICVKPYVTLYFDDFDECFSGMYGHEEPRRKFIIFHNDEELDN